MTAKTLEQYSVLVKKAIGKPGILSNLQVEASADFARYSEMFAEYEIKRAKFIDVLSSEGKSIASCEHRWLTEEDGQKWVYLKFYLRGLKQMTKAIESATYVANAEANNKI